MMTFYLILHPILGFIAYLLFAWKYKLEDDLENWSDNSAGDAPYMLNLFYCGVLAPIAFFHALAVVCAIIIQNDIKLFKKF